MKRRILTLAAVAVMVILTLCACAPEGVPAAPVLSHQTGKYDDSFTLTVTADERATVRYTLDGSDPTAESPEFPGEGLLIEDRSDRPNVLAAVPAAEFTVESTHTPPTVTKGTVIRAAAFNSKGESSPVVTATYLVGLNYKDIKIISLVMDAADLFDYEKGIYIFGKAHDDWMANDLYAKYAEVWEVEGNFSQTGRDWERDVLVQVIDEEGALGIEQDMGIRIMGTASRRHYQKSFRLVAREEYGSKHFDYELIDGLTADGSGEPLTRYKSFVLRNAGNDNGYSHVRDQFIQSRVEDRDFATQGTEPAIVFINGEYWGLYTITEDYSDNYIQYNFGVDNDNVILVKKGELEEGTEEDFAIYEKMMEEIRQREFASDEDYQWLCGLMDMESFIDHAAVHIYINNEDGLFQGNNWRIWRARATDPANEYADGRWRFMLYDTEYSTGLYQDGGGYDFNTLKRALSGNSDWSVLLGKLLQNETFRRQFVTTMMDLRNVNYERLSAGDAVFMLGREYRPYAPEQYARNGPDWVIMWSDLDTRFDTECGFVRDFIGKRYWYVPKMLGETLGLGETFDINVDVSDKSGGTVKVNTAQPDFENGWYNMTYFADYPVVLTAQAAEGYVFTGWSGDVTDTAPEITLQLTADTVITANFEKQ
ncbi:MAG: hypothetical protein E7554_02890 [Ruminococcaceae bacterium]|nr:hypothetical protein [Oscillospiraceae bacterium]